MNTRIAAALSKDEEVEILRAQYAERWGDAADGPFFLITVPLRVCPLGAHSDHQGGIVTGFTIDRSVRLLGRSLSAPTVSVVSVNFPEDRTVELSSVAEKIPGDWGNYLRGAARALAAAQGELRHGFRGILHGSMPIGGLSSSAAVTISYLRALEHVNGLASTPLETIMLVRAVENGYLGLHNGILDQSVIVSSKRGSLTVIDCATHTISNVPGAKVQKPWELLVVYSGLSRQLTATPFNQRVAECHQGAEELLRLGKLSVSGKPLLGDVPEEIYERHRDAIAEPLRRRADHFFSERARVRRGIDAWKEGDIEAVGKLVTASGESSIVNYESGSPALISLYEILAKTSGVYGTRFCGGGFQGCCLALIDPRRREEIAESVRAGYTARHPELRDEYSLHFCETADTVSVEVV